MLYCKQCGVQVAGSPERCPLCQGPLTGRPEEDMYPKTAEYSYGNALRWAALITIAAGAVCGAVNWSVPESGLWCLFVIAGLATTWLLLWAALRKRSSPAKAILWQLGMVCALSLLWDWCTGFHGWSVDFVLPIFIPCMQLAAVLTARALRLRGEEYLFYLALCVAAGLLPLLSLACGLPQVAYPSIVCGGISVVGLAALALFKGNELKAEIVKHIHL